MLKKNITALEVVVLAECLKLHLTSGDTLHFLNDNCKYMYKKKNTEEASKYILSSTFAWQHLRSTFLLNLSVWVIFLWA